MADMQGAAKLRKQLLGLTPAVKAALEKAVLKGAEDVAATARALVPVGTTGKLKASINAVLGDLPYEGEGGKVFGSTGAQEKNSLVKATVYAGSREAWYGRLVEFGTAPHVAGGKFAGAQHPGTPAQPFFFPAYRGNKKRAASRNTRAVNTAIKGLKK